jgi:hypothetical protein
MSNSTPMTLSITSAPALAAALRTPGDLPFAPIAMRSAALVPLYQVAGGSEQAEATAAAHVIGEVVERLRRLTAAYSEWDRFDAPAYFDLSHEQAAHLVRVAERVSTVHVIFFVDLLLPSFCAATTFWHEHFVPAYGQMRQEPRLAEAFHTCLQPQMVEHWHRLLAVVRETRTILAEDVGFLAANGAHEERSRWQRYWQTPPRPDLAVALTPPLADVPTLTLTVEFALPAHRQPDRLRRLRAARDRRRRHRLTRLSR